MVFLPTLLSLVSTFPLPPGYVLDEENLLPYQCHFLVWPFDCNPTLQQAFLWRFPALLKSIKRNSCVNTNKVRDGWNVV